MATTTKAYLLRLCLCLVTAINIAEAGRRSVLTDLYKQAAEQNRPLILVVDNHSNDERQAHQDHGVYKENKRDSHDGVPVHYMYPKASDSLLKSNGQEKSAGSKTDLLKYYLNRLLSQKQGQAGLKKRAGRSDDHNDVLNLDNHNYDKDVHERHDRDRDAHYKNRPLDRYYRPREDRQYKMRSQYSINRHEDRYHHDRDHNDRDRYDRDRHDRYRSDNDRQYRGDRYREDRNRADTYRSQKYRVDRDREDRYGHDRNYDRDVYYKMRDSYKDDRSHQKYQSPKDRDYGAKVMNNLLRISNDLNCDAKEDCKGTCYQRARVLRISDSNCEDLCDKKFSCEDSVEIEVQVKKQSDECDGRGSGSESCGEEKNSNISTRGYTDKDEEDDPCARGRCSK